MNFGTSLLSYDALAKGNFIVAPDLRDGRPPEDTERYNHTYIR